MRLLKGPWLRRLVLGSLSLLWGVMAGMSVVGAVSFSNNRPLIEYELSLGEAVQGSLELVSHSDEPVSVTVYLGDWRYTGSGDGAKEFAPPQTLPRSCAGWISFFPHDIVLAPHGRAVVDYTVRVPAEQPPAGGYYAVLFFESTIADSRPDARASGPDQAEGVEVRYAARLGSLFLINVKGTVRKEAALSNLSVAVGPEVTLSARLANMGNVTLKCEGSFHLMDQASVVVARGALPVRYLWPQQSAPVTATAADRPGPGRYSAIVTYGCGDNLVVVDEASITVP
jgi:hypothetical protein